MQNVPPLEVSPNSFAIPALDNTEILDSGIVDYILSQLGQTTIGDAADSQERIETLLACEQQNLIPRVIAESSMNAINAVCDEILATDILIDPKMLVEKQKSGQKVPPIWFPTPKKEFLLTPL